MITEYRLSGSIFLINFTAPIGQHFMSWNFNEIVNREGTWSVKYDLRKEIFGSKDVIPMWVADMDIKTPGFIISALKRRVDHEIFGYTYRPPEYYSSIVGWFGKRHNWNIKTEWICFSPGIVPALNFCTLAFTEPGDSIVVQPPVYFPFFSAVGPHGRKLVYNRLSESENGWKMDLDSFSDSIDPSTKAIIISNPHNPVGRVWKRDELLELAETCLKNNVIIISDEIHCDLILPGSSHVPVASLSDEISSITVTLVSPSKTFNLAGLSTSSVIISDPVLRKKFLSLTEKMHVGNGNLFGIAASIAAYTHGHEWLDSLNEHINDNVEYVTSFCRGKIPAIVPVRPEATYLVWLDCRNMKMSGKELQSFFIKEAHVGLNEGSTFGPGGEGFMRMNVATSKSILKKALEQIGTAYYNYKTSERHER